MAERDTLLSTLPADVRDDADAIYTAEATQDPRDVVAELHRRGKIDQGQLRRAVLSLEAGLPIRRVKENVPRELEPTILGPLGEGAMGEVLIARDEGLNRVVALKRIHPEQAASRGLMRRFYTEAQITAQLDHPAIVPIHGVYPAEDGSLAYTMKLVRGRTLEDYLEEAEAQARAGRVDDEHALQARLERFLNVCDALAYAHTKGVLHRDLKPENIMVGAFGEVMVMDWGIAKLLEGSNVELIDDDTKQSRKANATRVGQVIGTPRYMSPEQASGRNDTIGPASDQYALGLILQELSCFTPGCPRKVTLEVALTRAQQAKRDPMVASVGPNPPRELVAIVDKACALRPEQRYANVRELADDVRRFLRDEAVHARRDTVLQALGRFVSRRRTLVLLVVMGLLVALFTSTSLLFVAGVGAHEFRRWQMESRESRLVEVLGVTSEGAARVEEDLRRIDALVTGLGFAGERALAVVGEVDIPEKYDIGEAPPKRVPSDVYPGSVRADRPSLAVAMGSFPPPIPDDMPRKDVKGPFEVRDQLERFVSMGPQLGRVLLESGGVSTEGDSWKDAAKVVAAGKLPVRWVRIGTDEGAMAVAPGMGPASIGTGFRDEDWFKNAHQRGAATFTGPRVDLVAGGLVVTVAHPVPDHKQHVIAVAAADIVLDHLIDRMNPGEGATAYLIDAKGVVKATGSMKGAKAYEPPAFPSRAAFEAIQAHPEHGWLQVGSMIYSWQVLPSSGWTYVVEQAF